LFVDLRVVEFLDGLLPLVLHLNRLDLFWYLGFFKDIRLSRDLPDHLGGVLSLDDLVIGMVGSDNLDMLDLCLA
jgi:hypothetical protein